MNTATRIQTLPMTAPWSDAWPGIREQLWLMLQRARQRRQLATLSDAQLDDIGISRAEADAEAAKPFWVA